MLNKIDLRYSRSGSSFEFSEFRIQAKVPDPCGSRSNLQYILTKYIYKELKNLKFIQYIKKESNIYLPFSISYYSTYFSTKSPEFTVLFICSFAFFWIQIQNYNSGSRNIIPDPGKSSGSMRIRIRNTVITMVDY